VALERIAADYDAQIFVEIANDGQGPGIVFEDGMVAKPQSPGIA
jgi:hypothetical protein